MNLLLEDKYISEMVWGSNFSYILSDSSAFLPTEYKVLQNQADSGFVRCMKMLYNGRVQLFYLTNELKSLAALLPSLTADSFRTIAANLFADIINVKQNGFLSCQNIDISFDKIYIDPSTYRVSLVYLPLSRRLFENPSDFENELRTEFVKLISGVPLLTSPKTVQLLSDLSDGTLTMEDLYGRMNGGEGPGHTAVQGYLRLTALNASAKVEIEVTKDDFVIGKKAELCDGVISFSNTISRTHCRISRKGAQITVTDLQSANGTYINGIRLQPNRPYLLKQGDVIRLANSEFQVAMN